MHLAVLNAQVVDTGENSYLRLNVDFSCRMIKCLVKGFFTEGIPTKKD